MPALSVFISPSWPQEGDVGVNFISRILSENTDSDTSIFVPDNDSPLDKYIYDWGIDNGLRVTALSTDVNRYGDKALLKRTDAIIENSSRFLAFWDGQSEEVKDAIIIACKRLVIGFVYTPSGNAYILDPQQIGTKIDDFISVLERSDGDNIHIWRQQT